MFSRLRKPAVAVARAAAVGSAVTALVAAAVVVPAVVGPTVGAHAVTPAISATATSVKGIDVNAYTDPKLDWSSEAASGVGFALVKVSGGVGVTNSQSSAQITAAKNAGMVVGEYHLAAPNLGKTGAVQADWFIRQGGTWASGGSVLPPTLDLEFNDQQTTINQCFNRSQAQLTTWIQQYSAEITAKLGRAPMIYTSATFWSTCMHGSTAFSANPLWIAHYGSSVGSLPASWVNYEMWQNAAGTTISSGASKGSATPDSDVFNGSLVSLHQLADPAYGHGTTVGTRSGDYSGDGKADVLARIGTQGNIRLYKGTGKASFAAGYSTIGTGFQSFTGLVASGDANGDGIPDLYLLTPSGTLSFHPGVQGGGFGGSTQLAGSFSSMNLLVAVGDFNGDGHADVLMRDKVGTLWLYEGDGTGKLPNREQIGAGWNIFTTLVGVDGFSGTGSEGLVTKDANGQMLYYARTASGFAGHTVIGSGWNAYNTIVSPGDLTGDGRSDLFVRDSKGNVSIYAATGASKLSGRMAVTSGWSPFTWIG